MDLCETIYLLEMRLLISGSRIWDTATGQCLQTIVHEDNAPVVSVRFSPNGKYVLAWTLDGCIRLWDYVEGVCKKTYQGHENKKYSIGGAFGVYGGEAFVASGSEDGSIIFWDVKSKNILQKLEAHDGVTLWVDAHPTLDAIVSCGLDGKLKIWINYDEDLEPNGIPMEMISDDKAQDIAEIQASHEANEDIPEEKTITKVEVILEEEAIIKPEKAMVQDETRSENYEEMADDTVILEPDNMTVQDEVISERVEMSPEEDYVMVESEAILEERAITEEEVILEQVEIIPEEEPIPEREESIANEEIFCEQEAAAPEEETTNEKIEDITEEKMDTEVPEALLPKAVRYGKEGIPEHLLTYDTPHAPTPSPISDYGGEF